MKASFQTNDTPIMENCKIAILFIELRKIKELSNSYKYLHRLKQNMNKFIGVHSLYRECTVYMKVYCNVEKLLYKPSELYPRQ